MEEHDGYFYYMALVGSIVAAIVSPILIDLLITIFGFALGITGEPFPILSNFTDSSAILAFRIWFWGSLLAVVGSVTVDCLQRRYRKKNVH